MHPLIMIGVMLAEAAMRSNSKVRLPRVDGGISEGDGYEPLDEEEYGFVVDHAMKCGLPVAPDTANPETRDFNTYPRLLMDRGMLVGTNIPVDHPKVKWIKRDTVFNAIERTGKAVRDGLKAEEDMLEPGGGMGMLDGNGVTLVQLSGSGSRAQKRGLSQIIVPDGMSKAAAAEELMRQHDADMKEASYTREFPGYYYKDVSVAVRRAIENTFGWLNSINTPGGMFSPDQPPVMLDVTVGVRSDGSAITDKGFFGRAAVAAWGHGSFVETFASEPFRAGVKAKARRMHEPHIQAFFSEVERLLRTESIFKGKPVTVEHREGNDDEPDGIHMEIFHLRTNPNIVLNEQTQGIFDVLVHADLAESNKRIYLLTGSYGNGKTETALTFGARAMDAGYAFFYVKSPEHVAQILVAAKRYLPAVVFLEDVDQIASGERSGAINEILNTLDGTELKGCNVKILFTTNHQDKLNTALRRPGRIDHVIQFENPNKDAKREIITRLLGKENGFGSLDVDACVELLPDVEGAFIAEICKRAAQYGRIKGGVTLPIFRATVHGMEGHIKLMKEEPLKESSLEQALKVVGEHIK